MNRYPLQCLWVSGIKLSTQLKHIQSICSVLTAKVLAIFNSLSAEIYRALPDFPTSLKNWLFSSIVKQQSSLLHVWMDNERTITNRLKSSLCSLLLLACILAVHIAHLIGSKHWPSLSQDECCSIGDSKRLTSSQAQVFTLVGFKIHLMIFFI